MRTFDDLFGCLVAGDETTQIEAKKSEELGRSTQLTITAFANEPGLGGGYLLLGVSRRVVSKSVYEYDVVGVPDADKIQQDLATQCCNTFTSQIRPELAVHIASNGKRVVVARIPEAQPNEKPVYIRSKGIQEGCCRRIGSTDQRCSADDLALLFGLRNENSYDETLVDNLEIGEIERSALTAYRSARRELNPAAEELRYSNEKLLLAVGAAVLNPSLSSPAITRAGLLLFGKKSALRRFAPSARIDYIIVPGKEWVTDLQERYRSIEIQEPLVIGIPKIVNFVLQDLPTTFLLKGRRARRREVPAIPHAVIREAVVNAVMHRTYRTHEPIQIIRYSNRLVIKNPGHSLVATERLGEPGSATRNENLAAVLHELGYAETKGTGIAAMRKHMNEANLTLPIFRSSREEDLFEVILLTHHLVDEPTVEWLKRFTGYGLSVDEAKGLVLVRETGHIDNAAYRMLNGVDVLTASVHLRRLRDLGVLISHGKGTATFYTLAETHNITYSPMDKEPKSIGLPPTPGPSKQLQLSPELVGLLRRVGDRSDKGLVRVAILRLCGLRPLGLQELAKYLNRHPAYLKPRFVGPMLKRGELQYLYPDKPAHPRQAYVTSPTLIDLAIPEDPKPRRRSKAPRLPGL